MARPLLCGLLPGSLLVEVSPSRSGLATLRRTLRGPQPRVMAQHAVAGTLLLLVAWSVEPASAEVYTSNGLMQTHRITVHGNGAVGNAAPLRTIEGDATRLVEPTQIFADVLHGELFVANPLRGAIEVFTLSAAGNQAPLRTLSGAMTLINTPGGVAVDLVHDELIVASVVDNAGGLDGPIAIFPRTASGNVAPLRAIHGPATGIAQAFQVAVDPAADEIFVASWGEDGSPPSGVRVFRRTANGNVAPLRTLAGPATQLMRPVGVFVDPTRNELLVSDAEQGTVSVFPRTANGNSAPLRRIGGPATGLVDTRGIALLGTSEVVVADLGRGVITGGFDDTDDAVLFFARNATGNVSPLRRINGPASGVLGPNAVAVVSPSLQLGGGRFGVQAVFRTASGGRGDGRTVMLTPDTGYFWFFNQENVEVVVKVLNGCGVNGYYWFFAGGLTDVNVDLIVTDYASGQVRVYTNPQKTAFQPIQDTAAFATCALPTGRADAWTAGAYLHEDRVRVESLAHEEPQLEQPAFVAEDSVAGDSLLLSGDRFEVRAFWERLGGPSGVGHPVALTPDTGYFWFFNQENVEVVVKVLNGCALTNRYWVFAGGLTDVRVELTVDDTLRGTSIKTYLNPQKTPFQPIQDTSAFATCP